MIIPIASLALLWGQLKTLRDSPVVRLPSGQTYIPATYRGDIVELTDNLSAVHLPNLPPKMDPYGVPWAVDIRNAGTKMVTVFGNAQFSVHISAGRSVHIVSTEAGYALVK